MMRRQGEAERKSQMDGFDRGVILGWLLGKNSGCENRKRERSNTGDFILGIFIIFIALIAMFYK